MNYLNAMSYFCSLDLSVDTTTKISVVFTQVHGVIFKFIELHSFDLIKMVIHFHQF